MKKLINDPYDMVEEMVEGFCAAHDEMVQRIGRRAIGRRGGSVPGKVGVVIGGGSGHLPLFLGYVGRGMADAAPVGNVFASPPAKPILEATLFADAGAGVLFIYGNYSGDLMNFDRAAAQAAERGIRVETVRYTDDVASAPPDQIFQRRGIAGGLFVIKVAAAKAETLCGLAEVAAVARRANDATRTMGVALSACTVPANGRPTFSLAEEEMEIGLGVHGEPGRRRGKIEPVDRVVDEMVEAILGDLDYSGNDVAVLVNGLGATPYEELYLVYRRVAQILQSRQIRIRRKYVGEYVTSLEMAGVSISLLRLDAELDSLLLQPAACPMFHQGCP